MLLNPETTPPRPRLCPKICADGYAGRVSSKPVRSCSGPTVKKAEFSRVSGTIREPQGALQPQGDLALDEYIALASLLHTGYNAPAGDRLRRRPQARYKVSKGGQALT